HAYQRGVLYRVRSRAGAGLCQADQLLLHAETWQLAECRRMRAELPDEPMPERPPHRRVTVAASRDRDLGGQNECQTTRSGLAIQNRRRPNKTEALVPED